MSKHHVSHLQCSVLHDIDSMTNEELENGYDIEIYEDGVVWDNFEEREFASITEWGIFIARREEEENYATTSKIAGKWRFDDDRY